MRADRADCWRTSCSWSPSAARSTTLLLRDGFVTDEFIDLARTDNRTATQETQLDELKARLAHRVLSSRIERRVRRLPT